MAHESVSMHEFICMRQTAESYKELMDAQAHKVKMYETALEEIAWSNNSEWRQDRAKQALAQMRGVEL